MKNKASKPKNLIRYYDDRDILDEIIDESVDLVLDERLREDILSGKRKRNLTPINGISAFTNISGAEETVKPTGRKICS